MNHLTDGEITRALKAALRKAFPGNKFAVSTNSHESSIEWTDSGPAVEQAQDALVSAGYAELTTSWNGAPRFHLQNRVLYFNRYNVAERAAYQESLKRRAQEYEAQRQREEAAVQAAKLARGAAMPRPSYDWLQSAKSDPAEERKTFAALEALRQRAEDDVATDTERQHRPTWAPPLIIAGELLEACIGLGLLTTDDKPIARLWAQFASPKRSGRVLREHNPRHALAGIACRGFELHAGGERGPTRAILFEAQRDESGEWQFGPWVRASDYHSPRRAEWERLVRERERLPDIYRDRPDVGRDCAESVSAKIAAIDAQDLAAARVHHRRQQLRERAIELAKARVLDFAGAPGVQMAQAGRLSGMCFNCYRALTDPISLERGIGPECLHNKVALIKHLAHRGRVVPVIASLSGMPEEFVTAVLAEQQPTHVMAEAVG